MDDARRDMEVPFPFLFSPLSMSAKSAGRRSAICRELRNLTSGVKNKRPAAAWFTFSSSFFLFFPLPFWSTGQQSPCSNENRSESLNRETDAP